MGATWHLKNPEELSNHQEGYSFDLLLWSNSPSLSLTSPFYKLPLFGCNKLVIITVVRYIFPMWLHWKEKTLHYRALESREQTKENNHIFEKSLYRSV